MNNKLTFCILCKSSATLMCQRCRELYCSINCQLLDWPQHKRICIPMPPLIPFLNHQIIDMNTPPASPKPKIHQNRNGIVAVPTFEEPNVVDQPIMRATPPSTSTTNKNIVNNNLNGQTNDITILSQQIIPPRVIKQDVPITTAPNTTTTTLIDPVNVRTFSNPSENNQNYPSLRQHLRSSLIAKEELKINTNLVGPKLSLSQQVSNNMASSSVATPSVSRTFSTPPPSIINQSDKRSIKSISNWDKPFLPPNNDSFTNVIIQFVEPKKSDIFWVTLLKLERDCEKLVKEINKNITKSSPGCCATDIELNRVFAVPFEGVYYRAVILELLNPLNEAFVRLIDYGNEFYVKLNDIRQPIPLMKNLNAFAFPIQFKTTSNEKKSNSHTNFVIGDQLEVKIINELQNGVYLVESPPLAIPDNVNVENLNITNECSPSTSNPLTNNTAAVATTTAATKYTNQKQCFRINNLEFIHIPPNKKLKLYLLDSSQINEGFITACILDTEKIQKADDMSNKINVYCKNTKEKSYSPEIGELCLAKYNLDGLWYRAMCLKINNSDSFSLSFVDYGNLSIVTSKDIRQITSEFLYPCLANDCSIAGVPDKIKPKRAAEFFQTNPVFDIEYAEIIEENSYLIHMQF